MPQVDQAPAMLAQLNQEDSLGPATVEHVQRGIASGDDLEKMFANSGVDMDAIKKKVYGETTAAPITKALEAKFEPQKQQIVDPNAKPFELKMSKEAQGASAGTILADVGAKAPVGAALDIADRVWNGIRTITDYASKWGNSQQEHMLPKADLGSMMVNDTPEGKVARSVMTYVAPLAVGGTTALGSKVVGNAVIDFLGMDPHGGRMSDLAQEVPFLRNPLAASLVSDPNDTELVARLKNMTEGIITLGTVGLAVKGFKSAFAKDTAEALASAVSVQRGAKEAEAAVMSEKQVAQAEAKMGSNAIPATPVKAEVVPPEQGDLFKYSDEQLKKLYPDSPEFQLDASKISQITSIEEASKAVGINLTKLNTSDDALAAVASFAEQNKSLVDKVRNTMSFEEIQGAANEILTNPRLAGKLVNPQARNPVESMAAQIVAHKILVGSAAEELARRAEAVLSDSTNSAAHASFADSIDAFGLLYSSMRGKQTEAAVATAAGRIVVEHGVPVAARGAMFDEAIKLAGGKDNLMNTAGLIKAASKIPATQLADKAGAIARMSGYQRFSQATSFYVLNNLLSFKSLFSATAGNIVNLTAHLSDTVNAAAFNLAKRSPEGITFAQVGQELHGLMGAFGEAFANGAKALQSGRSVTAADSVTKIKLTKNIESIKSNLAQGVYTPAQADEAINKALRMETTVNKLDLPFHNPISSENLMTIGDDSWLATRMLGKTLDTVGAGLGLPSRLIAPADSIFGTLAYRSKVQGLAYAEGIKQGLKGQELSAFIKKTIANPTDEIHKSASAIAQELTYSNPLDGIMGAINGWANEHPLVKTVFPIIKTTVNETKFVYAHSPFALANSSTLAAIKQGGQEGTIAAGKIMTGGLGVGMMAYLAGQGIITGDVPKHPGLEKAIKESNKGWQPNSIKVGDTYVSMKKFGILGSVMRIGAMLNDSRNYLDDHEYQQLSIAALGAAMDAHTPESYIQSIGSFVDFVHTVSDPSSSAQDKNAAEKFMLSMIDRLYPLGNTVKSVTRELDPVVGDKSGPEAFLEKVSYMLKDKTPYYNKEVPAQRNIFGEVVYAPTSWGPDMLSPFASSYGKTSELNQKIRELNQFSEQMRPVNPDWPDFNISMPPRSIPNDYDKYPFQLTPQEYDKYVLYSAGYDENENPRGKNLREELGKLLNKFDFKKIYSEHENGPLEIKVVLSQISSVVNTLRDQGKEYLYKQARVQERMKKEAEARKVTAKLTGRK